MVEETVHHLLTKFCDSRHVQLAVQFLMRNPMFRSSIANASIQRHTKSKKHVVICVFYAFVLR